MLSVFAAVSKDLQLLPNVCGARSQSTVHWTADRRGEAEPQFGIRGGRTVRQDSQLDGILK